MPRTQSSSYAQSCTVDDRGRHNTLFGRVDPKTSHHAALQRLFVASVRTHTANNVLFVRAQGPVAAQRAVQRLLNLATHNIVRVTEDSAMTISPSKLKFQHFQADEAEVAHDWDGPDSPWLVNAVIRLCDWFDQTANLNNGLPAVLPEQLIVVGVTDSQVLKIEPGDYFVIWQGA